MPAASDATERVAYLDRQGIDAQWVLSTFAFNPISRLRRTQPERGPDIMRAYNTWAAQRLSAYPERLMPVAVLDPVTMDRATFVAELTRMRDLGSRSFLFWFGPVHGKSLSHPDLGWLWAAAADLGVIPMLHVGAGRPAIDAGWLNNGRSYPSSITAYPGQLHQIAELMLTELLIAGAFVRHPKLRILVCELGIDWVPTWINRLDRYVAQQAKTDSSRWPWPKAPSDYVKAHLRVSPLERRGAFDVIERLGDDVVVFSSDYPHPEGGSDAVARYRDYLGPRIPAASLEKFFGSVIERDLALGA